jgi:hypothetical protein
MTNLNKVLFATALAATISLATNASAQYRPTDGDGIAASPKVRQMLNERAAATRVVPATPTVTVTYRNPAEGLTASPKARQMLAERKVVITGAPAMEVAAARYTPASPDGITASPKVRSQLNERPTTILIAPLK